MVKLAVTARKQQDNSTYIQTNATTTMGMSMPVKRCFNQTTENSCNNNACSEGGSSVDSWGDEAPMATNQSMNDDEHGLNSSNQKQAADSANDSHSMANSLPKNKRLALRQCLVSR